MNKVIFEEKLKSSEYGRKYIELITEISKLQRKPVKEKGYNLHHIQPRALGGVDSVDNLIKLTVLEHCIVHALLAKAIPCEQTLRPVVRLSTSQVTKLSDLDKCTLEDICGWASLYEEALRQPRPLSVIEKIKETKRKNPYKATEETKRKISLATKGRPKSEETRRKMSLYQKGRPKSELHKLHNREAHKGLKHSEEWKRKHSLAVTGKIKSAETRKKLSESLKGKAKSELHRFHLSQAKKGKPNLKLRGRIGNCAGRKWINNGLQSRLVSPDTVASFLDHGWSIGRLK